MDEAQAPAGAPAGADVATLITETDKNLAMLAKAAGGGALPPEVAELFAAASDTFRQAVDMALSASEGGAQPPAPQPEAEASGMAPPESGGRPGARPMSMGG